MTCNFLHYLPAATTRKSGLLVLILLVAMTSAHGGYLALFDAQDLSQSTQIWHHIPVANNNSLPGNLSVLPSFAHQTAVLGTERSRHALHLGWIGLIVMAWFAWWRKKVERKENEYFVSDLQRKTLRGHRAAFRRSQRIKTTEPAVATVMEESLQPNVIKAHRKNNNRGRMLTRTPVKGIRKAIVGVELPVEAGPDDDGEWNVQELLQRLILFQTITETIDQGLAWVDHRGQLLYVNPACQRMLGIDSPVEMARKTAWRYLNPRHINSVQRQIRRQLLLKGYFTGEMTLTLKDGSALPVLASINEVSTDEKNGRAYVIAITDLKEQKRAEEQTRMVRQLQDDLMRNIPIAERLMTTAYGILDAFQMDFCQIWLAHEGSLEEITHGEESICGFCCKSPQKGQLLQAKGPFLNRQLQDESIPVFCYEDGAAALFTAGHLSSSDVAQDPLVPGREWAGELGLTSFNGHLLRPANSAAIGVLGVYGRRRLTNDEKILLSSLCYAISQAILQAQIQDEHRREEERFRRIFEESTDPIFLYYKDGTIVDTNDAGCRLLGMERAELLARNILEFSDPNGPQHIGGLLASYADSRFEMRIKLENGRKMHLDVSARAVSSSEGLIQAVMRDITHRKEAEESLRRREEELRIIFEAMPTGVLLVDSQAKTIELANKVAANILGVPVGGLYGANMNQFEWKAESENEVADKEVNEDGSEDFLKDGDGTEDFLKDAKGQSIPVIRTITPLNLHGRQFHLQSFTDITALRQAQDQLRKQNDFLHSVLESLTHPFSVIDANTYEVKVANSAAGPVARKVGAKCHSMSHGNAEPCNEKDHPCPIRLIKKTCSSVTVEHVHKMGDGTSKLVEVHGYPIFDDEGKVSEIIEYCIDVTERHEAQQRLQESEQLLRTTIESTADGIYVSDADGNIKLWNNRLMQIWGVTNETMKICNREELVKHASSLMLNSEDFIQRWQQVKTCAEPALDILRLKDGRLIHRFSAALVTNDQIMGRICSFRDVTDQAKAEQALIQAQARLERAISGTSDSLWEWDLMSNEVWFSPLMLVQLGYEEGEFAHDFETWRAHIHPDDVNLLDEALHNHLKFGKSYDVEYRIRTKDERYIWFRTRGEATRDADGKPTILAGSNQDITIRKQAQRALAEKEEYLRIVMSTIQTGVVISTTADDIIVDANRHALKLIGHTLGELRGQPATKWVCDGESPTESGFNRTADGQLRTSYNGILQVRLSQATTMVQGRGMRVRTFQDITDIKALLDQQAVNIGLANRVLSLVNAGTPRHIPLAHDCELFVHRFSMPCHAAGGDHDFVRVIYPSQSPDHLGTTVISVKDQSGHEVNCVLRSIITDLLHNAMLSRAPNEALEEVITHLNNDIIQLGAFDADDFVTAVVAQIDNATLNMRYLSCGHPPFIIIRGGNILTFPDVNVDARNLPLASLRGIAFKAGDIQLRPGDHILFYTDGLLELPKFENAEIPSQELHQLILKVLSEHKPCPVSVLIEDLLRRATMAESQDSRSLLSKILTDDITLLGVEVEYRDAAEDIVIQPQSDDEVGAWVDQINDDIERWWKKSGFQGNTNALGTILEEGLLNAWKHGNKRDPNKVIRVRWRVGNDFQLEIIDQGKGFMSGEVSNPTLPSNMLFEHGRGIFMIRYYADHVCWVDGGTRMIASLGRYAQGPSGGELLTARQSTTLSSIWQSDISKPLTT